MWFRGEKDHLNALLGHECSDSQDIYNSADPFVKVLMAVAMSFLSISEDYFHSFHHVAVLSVGRAAFQSPSSETRLLLEAS